MKIKKMLLGCLLTAAIFSSCDKDDDDDNDINSQDRNFAMMAAMANFAEIDAGSLAVSKGTDPGITGFGQMMVNDHGSAKTELQDMASDLGLNAPDSLDAEHVALKAQLMTLSGRAFDSVYIHSQVKDHQTAITLHRNQSENGDNARLRNYANQQLPHLEEHLEHAQNLAANY